MLKGLSLFANVGIGETYLKNNNIEIVVANELLVERARFYSHFHKESEMIDGDITKPEIYNKIIEKSKELSVDFILATPPCQGMSIAGRMEEDDPRNSLIIKVIDSILELKPKYAIIENVIKMPKTYISIEGEKVLIKDFIEDKLSDNYNVQFAILDAADFGTPQHRKRSFVLISRKDVKQLKEPVPYRDKITVRDTIGHLPSIEAGEKTDIPLHNAKNHNDNHILWMKNTPTGKTAFDNEVHFPKKDRRRIKGFSTTYKRIEWDKPAPTITMGNGSVSSQNNVHPGRKNPDGTYSDARVLTIKELILLSGLPEDWTPPDWSNENLTRKVIGECLLPKMLEEITKQLK